MLFSSTALKGKSEVSVSDLTVGEEKDKIPILTRSDKKAYGLKNFSGEFTMQELKNLNTKHRAVARYLALGLSLKEVCEQFNLNLDTWRQVTSTPLFKHEQERIMEELEDRVLEDAVKDPVLAKLKTSALKAVERLISEIDNGDKESGASATSRIKAAESILDRCGYNHREKETGVSAIFIPLSQDKLDSILGKAPLLPQPQNIQG